MVKLLLIVWCSTVIFYLLFLVYASYHTARRAGREVPVTSLVIAGPPVVAGYVLDLVWNTVLGSLLFLEVPWKETWRFWLWTFTARLIRWKDSATWRGRQARYWARQLNWADPGHV